MSVKRIAVIPGDGIGPEVMREGVRVLEEVTRNSSTQLRFEHLDWSANRFLATGQSLPDHAMQYLQQEFDAIYLGAFGDPRVPDMTHAAEILLGIRRELDLYINFRPVRLLDSALSPLRNTSAKIDFVLFRENVEGPYGLTGRIEQDPLRGEIAVQESITTRPGVERIVRAAFDYARLHRRKRVCLVDKANALPSEGAVWTAGFAAVASDFPEMETSHLYADAAAMKMVLDPASFDVVVTGNLFGDILSDIGAALQGGPGLAASANLHPGRTSMFEPIHGSDPPSAGCDTANPIAAVMAGALMLEFLGMSQEASSVEAAVTAVIRDGEVTRDLGGRLGTKAAGEAILNSLKQLQRQL